MMLKLFFGSSGLLFSILVDELLLRLSLSACTTAIQLSNKSSINASSVSFWGIRKYLIMIDLSLTVGFFAFLLILLPSRSTGLILRRFFLR